MIYIIKTSKINKIIEIIQQIGILVIVIIWASKSCSSFISGDEARELDFSNYLI